MMVQHKSYYKEKIVFLEHLKASIEPILFPKRGNKTSKFQASFRILAGAIRRAHRIGRGKDYLSSREFTFSDVY